MKLTLLELRQLIYKSLLTELKIVGPHDALGNDEYRAVELQTTDTTSRVALSGRYGGLHGGNFIVVPVTLSRYGNGGLDGYIKKLGFNKDPNDKSQPYYHLSMDESLVVNHANKTVDLDVAEYANHLTRRPGRRGGGNKTYIIPHGDSAYQSIERFQKILKALAQVDKRLTLDYKIVGNPTYENMTVGDILKERKPGEHLVTGGHFKPMTFYHGTSEKRLVAILKKGLVPGNTPFEYGDLVKNYSEHNVYLTASVPKAENYATRAGVDDACKAVVLKVIVHDLNKLIMDEDSNNWLNVINPEGEETQIHFKHNHWKTWPNADQIMQKFTIAIAREVNREGTVAYKGRIPTKDISIYSSYKPASMSKSPKWDEFKDAREKTLNTYKRDPAPPKPKKVKEMKITKGQLRKIIAEELAVGGEYQSNLDKVLGQLKQADNSLIAAHNDAPQGEARAIIAGLHQDLFQMMHDFRGYIQKLKSKK
jgi:hypothetical protein